MINPPRHKEQNLFSTLDFIVRLRLIKRHVSVMPGIAATEKYATIYRNATVPVP